MSEYQLPLARTVYFPHPEAGVLRFSDLDRVDFLQRQTTNDLTMLEPGRVVVTVLTSPTARILDVLHLLSDQESILGVTLPGRAEDTARFLKSKIFFMDKVALLNQSREFLLVDLEGAEVNSALMQLGITCQIGDFRVTGWEIAGQAAWVWGQKGLSGGSYRLLVPQNAAEASMHALERAGVARLTPADWETLRVAAGLPAAGHELTEEYTPLETGLTWAISTEKGCYTGQEVIAKQITYDKVTRNLVGLRLQENRTTGERVYVQGSAVGKLTSTVESPRFGPIALGVIKKPYDAPGTQVEIVKPQPDESGSSVGSPAVVTELPFH